MNFDDIRYLSFDCYGTLIDWESGILPVVHEVFSQHGRDMSDEQILEAYGRYEMAAENPYQRYRDVLRTVMDRFAFDAGVSLSVEDRDALGESLPNWPAFPDTVDALRRMSSRFGLVILSNIDRDLFAETQRHLPVDFSLIVTAEDVQSYKPGFAHFERAMKTLGITPRELLHIGQSPFHDVAPTRKLGISNVLVRREDRTKFGATIPDDAVADLEVSSLSGLADLLRA